MSKILLRRDARKIGEASWQGKTTVFSAVGNAIAFSQCLYYFSLNILGYI